MGKESCENEGQEVGRRRRTYVNNVNALGNGNQHVNKLNELDELNKGNNKITEHRAILLKSQQTNKISQQPENWVIRNGPDLVQAFPKKWWVESDCTAFKPYIDLYLLINYFQQQHTGMISIHMCYMVSRLKYIIDK